MSQKFAAIKGSAHSATKHTNMFVTQRTDEWFKDRRGKLTASVAGAAIGVSAFQTPLKCMKQLVGDEPFNGNIFTQWGTQNEPNAAMEYSVLTGYTVLPAGFCVHPVLNWIGASPDGYVEEEGLVELKCPWKRKKLPLPDTLRDIHLHYFIQIQIQMEVTGKEWCDLFFWTPDAQRVFRFKRDRELFQNMLPAMTNFYAIMVRMNSSQSAAWRKLVKTDLPDSANKDMIEYCRARMQECAVEPPFSNGLTKTCSEASRLPSLIPSRGSPLAH